MRPRRAPGPPALVLRGCPRPHCRGDLAWDFEDEEYRCLLCARAPGRALRTGALTTRLLRMPSVDAAGLLLAEAAGQAFQAWGVRCARAEEFLAWYEAAVYEMLRQPPLHRRLPSLENYCQDAVEDVGDARLGEGPWCRTMRAVGRCVRHEGGE